MSFVLACNGWRVGTSNLVTIALGLLLFLFIDTGNKRAVNNMSVSLILRDTTSK